MAAPCRTFSRLFVPFNNICRNARLTGLQQTLLARYSSNLSSSTNEGIVPNRIYVKGFSDNTTESELESFFSAYGTIKRSKILSRLGETGGLGFVIFEKDEDANKILTSVSSEGESLVFKDRVLTIKQTQQETVDRTAVDYEEEADVLYSKLQVEVKGHDTMVLDSYQYFITYASKCLGLSNLKVSKPPVDIVRRSLLKSVHIFKKHVAQYEQRTYYRVFTFEKVTGSTADTFLEYIQRNLPEGVAMKVTKHQLEALPGHLKPPARQKLEDKQTSTSTS